MEVPVNFNKDVALFNHSFHNNKNTQNIPGNPLKQTALVQNI
jgi:hypothetical protein